MRSINALADPNIALPVLIFGAFLIYAEFLLPGRIIFGVVGAVCAALAAASLAQLPLDVWGVALMLLGLLCFALEAKAGAHGALALIGACCMFTGALTITRWSVALAVTLPFAAVTTLLLSIAARARRNKIATGSEAMMGLVGVSVGELNPTGTIFVRGEYWAASAQRRVDASEQVRIVGINGLTLMVESLPESERRRGE
ncbi:MAG TPA: NfeD family protein [Bryobacteraceae bacterium]|nr:NfeD family protein [Bryobacteraceae bacterium]